MTESVATGGLVNPGRSDCGADSPLQRLLATSRSADPVSGKVRRHHLDEKFYYFVASAVVPWEPSSLGQILLMYPLPYFAYCIFSCFGFIRGRETRKLAFRVGCWLSVVFNVAGLVWLIAA
jgi:hypothetical protein